MAALASYKDPGYRALANAVTADLGLPEDVLYSIITKGEKSNANQVSSSGARTVAQIIPATRKAILDKHGVDAYLSPENAVRAAGLILRDNLDRAKGDVREAVTQYVAGTGGERGPVTRAYVNRVLGAEPRAKPAAPVAPARVIEAFNSGQMTAAQAANFKKSLDSGQFSLPDGAKLNERVTVKPNEGAAVIPKRVIDNYTNRSDMTDAQRDLIDRDIAAGTLRLPDGAKLNRPAELSAADRLGMGVRGVMTGAAGLADIVANPVSAIADAVIPGDAFAVNPTRTGMEGLADQMGLAKPATPGEKLANAGVEGLTGGLATAGAAPMLSALPGVAGQVGRVLASAPITDIVSSGVSTVSSEAANQAGGGPVGELAAGVVGALGPVGLAKVAERVAARFGPKVGKVVAEVPREVVLDEAGKLTDEGVEVAARQGVAADELAAAYDEAATAPQMVRTHEGVDYPVEVIDPTPVVDAEGVPHIKVRGEDGAEGFVPQNEVREGSGFGKRVEEPAAPAAAAVDETVTPPRAPDAPLPATAAARLAEAKEMGIDLTPGQATQDAPTQARENDLATGAGGSEPERVSRGYFADQSEQIKTTAQNIRASLGDPSISSTDLGEVVKTGLRDLFNRGKAGVTAAYERLKDVVEGLGDNSKGLLDLETGAIRAKGRELLNDDTVSSELRTGLKQVLAKHGLIGEKYRYFPDTGETVYMVKDAEGNLVRGGSFVGQVEPLTLANSEKFRQRVNDTYNASLNRNPQLELMPLLEEATTEAAARAVKEGRGDVAGAATEARGMHRDVKRTFEAGDVIDRLIAWKKGKPGTDAVKPEDIFKLIYGGEKGALTNVRKVKAILLAAPSEASKAAWRAIQAHAVGKLLDEATILNSNIAGEIGSIGAEKLRTAINKFGREKLNTLLDKDDFDRLMKFERVLGYTISQKGTVNPPGTAAALGRFLQPIIQKLSPALNMTGVGQGLALAGDAIKRGNNLVNAKKTAESLSSFTPEAAAKADDKASRSAVDVGELLREFISTAYSDRLIAPLLAQTSRSGQQPATQEPSSER